MLELWKALLARLHVGVKGQDLTEYALLVALIAIVVIVAVIFFGTEVSRFFNDLATEVGTWLVPT